MNSWLKCYIILSCGTYSDYIYAKLKPYVILASKNAKKIHLTDDYLLNSNSKKVFKRIIHKHEM